MKKQFAIVCAVFVLLLGALCSCNNNAHPSNSSGNNSHISNASSNDSHISNASGNNSHVSNASSNDTSGNDNLLGDTNNTDNLVKNIELHTTSIDNEYYPMICAGKYLGIDMPNDIGNYYKEILSFGDFCALVEHPEKIDENLFENNFVLVIKRVSGGYFADIGFKNYDTHFHSIELDSFPISQGTDNVKIRFDYVVIPKYRAQMNEDHRFVGNLGIKENDKEYYAVGTEQKTNENGIEQSKYFENLKAANSYLSNNGYAEIPNFNYNDSRILLLCLNISVGKYESSTQSCYLGFKDFNATASDVYITLERNIVNEDYGNDTEYRVFAIVIPNEILCIETIENPTIHILVNDNVSQIVR